MTTERAWEIYSKRAVRTVHNEYKVKPEQARKDKIVAVKKVQVIEHAKAAVKLKEPELAERMNAKSRQPRDSASRTNRASR